MQKERVVIGLSGGVDSSVAAALLVEQGYDVIGVFVLGWLGEENFPCAWQKEEADARAVAEKLGIQFHTINLAKEYKARVIDDFLAKYQQGLTPNPDVLCNSEIKFGALLDAIRQFEPDYLATGHYAKIGQVPSTKNQAPNNIHITIPKDKDKDQTYFLWRIKPSVLPKILFPLGDLTKKEVRSLASKYQLSTATKKDSQGVCFIGSLKVREFLRHYLSPKPGQAILKDGRVIATHQGANLYTIGQRLSADSVDWVGDVPPLYVIAKDLAKNQIIVGPDKNTFSSSLSASQLNWHQLPSSDSFQCQARVRYRQVAVETKVKLSGDRALVEFDEPIRAITPGQSIVFYQGDVMLGGGIIDENQK